MDRLSRRGGRRATPRSFFGRPLKGTDASLALTVLLILSMSIVCHAGSATMSVTATVLSKSNCKFDSKDSTLNFGALDPGNPIDATTSVSIGFVCMGSAPVATFAVTEDDGLYESGPNASRMRHTVVLTEYLPYSLALNPASGTVPKNAPQLLTISGTVRGTDYQNAYAGNFSDTVVVTLLP